MMILTPVCLLLSLAAAAAVSADQSPTSPLDKRDSACFPLFGDNIFPAHCTDALDQMRREAESLRVDQHRYVGPFSRNSQDQRFKVPKLYRTPSCTIGIDLTDPRSSIRTFWSERIAIAESLIRRCAMPPSGTGGEYKTYDGFTTVVVNESRLDPILHNIWAACLRMGLQGPDDNIGQCATNLGDRYKGKVSR